MRLVRQEHENGCVVATTAMLLDLSYRGALDLFGEGAAKRAAEDGFGDYVMESILVERGFALAKRYRVLQPGNRERVVWPAAPWADARYCALVKHESGICHSVAMLATGRVLDPFNPARTKLTDFHEVCSITAVVPIGAWNRRA